MNSLVSQVKSGENILEVNLLKQKIKNKNISYSFTIDSYKKDRLVNGWDDIDLTLKEENNIAKFEKEKIRNWIMPEHDNE